MGDSDVHSAFLASSKPRTACFFIQVNKVFSGISDIFIFMPK